MSEMYMLIPEVENSAGADAPLPTALRIFGFPLFLELMNSGDHTRYVSGGVGNLVVQDDSGGDKFMNAVLDRQTFDEVVVHAVHGDDHEPWFTATCRGVTFSPNFTITLSAGAPVSPTSYQMEITEIALEVQPLDDEGAALGGALSGGFNFKTKKTV